MDALPRQAGGKGDLGVHLRWAFLPACRGKGHLMDLVCACNGLFPLRVEEEAVSWTWCALAMGFSPCLSKKRPSHGLGGNARDGLSPLPVKEKAVSWTWCALAGGFPRRPKKPPEVPGELSKPKHAIPVNKCSTKVMVFGTRSKLYVFRFLLLASGGPQEAPGGLPTYFLPCLSKKRPL